MMYPISVRGYYADQGSPQDWGKSKQFTTRPAKLAYLNAVNQSGATVYVELYDTNDGSDLTAKIPRVLPCPDITTGGYAEWRELDMRSGIFVRAVAAVGGALIGGNNVKFDCGYMDHIIL